MHIDSASDFSNYEEYLDGEPRFSAIKELKKEEAEKILKESKNDAINRLETLKTFSKKDEN